MRTILLLMVCCVCLAACGNGKSGQADAAAHHENHKPTLDVKVDVAGNKATVTVTTDLHISPEHYGQARHSGEGHIHMYLDNGEKVGVKAEKHVFPDLKPGKHTLKVSLHNNDHTPYDVTKVVAFDVQ